MTDTYDGFAFGMTSPDVNSTTGKVRRRLLVIAKDMTTATEIAKGLLPRAQYEERGPAILARARALGISDDDGNLDPEA